MPRNSSIAILVLTVVLCGSVQAKDLGTVGKTYPIAERDSLAEIQEKARHIDLKHLYAQARPEKYRPVDLKKLPRAVKARIYQVDMTYTLENDIPDGKGGILYPRGYTFNPLDYVPFGKVLVLIDGDDRQQVEWFFKSQYRTDPKVMLLLTGGSYMPLQKSFGRPIFYATQPIIQRFGLSAVPSVVRAKGRQMEVQEIFVRNKKSASERLSREVKCSTS